jgi:aspartyl protease family protein
LTHDANKLPDGTSRMGRFMVFAAWILTAALLTWVFSGLLDWQRNPNSGVQTTISADAVKAVALKRNRYGHYVANGRINDHPVEFLLDTGATHVSVPVNIARRLGLKPGARRLVQTANGRIITYATMLDSVKLGEIELTQVAASINPHSNSREVLLGMAFLKHLELIQRGDTLTIRQHR